MATYVRPIPFKATPPGAVLKDELAYRGISQKDFARQIGVPAPNLSRLIKGNSKLTKDWAIKIGEALGTPASIWLNLQHHYDEDLLRIAERESAEQLAHQKEMAWGEVLCLKEIYKRLSLSHLKLSERVAQILQIAGESPLDMHLSTGYFKRSVGLEHPERDKAIKTWQLIVLLKARQLPAPSIPYEKGKEQEAATRIAQLAREGVCTLKELRSIIEKAGILLIEEPHFAHCPVDAFSTWCAGRPLIAITKRYNDMDKLVFDVLHELGHIHLHINEQTTVGYIQIDSDYHQGQPQECEANQYAADQLIPPATWKQILTPQKAIHDFDHHRIIEAIARNAKRLGVAPSLAVSRYKKENSFYLSKQHRTPKIK